MHRRSVSIWLLVTLAVSSAACGKPTSYGGEERPTIVAPPPSSPEPSTEPTGPAPTPEETPTVASPAGPEPTEHEVAALNGNVYDTYDLQARAGDFVLFENTASDGVHSFTIEGTPVDSGELEGPSGRYRFEVKLAAGEYSYRCTAVPYMVGGKLIVY